VTELGSGGKTTARIAAPSNSRILKKRNGVGVNGDPVTSEW
jgi:hypothetical protein